MPDTISTPINSSEDPTQEKLESPFGEDLLLVTDADISEEIYGSYQGFKFNCPICKIPSIMVNNDMIPICLKCGRRIIVRSQFINNQTALRTEAEAKVEQV